MNCSRMSRFVISVWRFMSWTAETEEGWKGMTGRKGKAGRNISRAMTPSEHDYVVGLVRLSVDEPDASPPRSTADMASGTRAASKRGENASLDIWPRNHVKSSCVCLPDFSRPH